MTTVLAETTRGGVRESIHHGVVVVANTQGEVVAAAGDPDWFAFYRSSAKPFQAVPLIESGAADRFGVTPAELALSCASHNAEYRHQTQVLAYLAKLELGEGALQCGAPLPSDPSEHSKVILGERAKSPLQCDCSGKHTGMLAACKALGLPIDTYMQPTHPLQVQIKQVLAEVCRVRPEDFVMGTDGCSLPTFGTSVSNFARSWAALAAPEKTPAQFGGAHATALVRLRSAMIAHPENVAGENELVTNVMRVGGGAWACKSGAEGLFCFAAIEQGLGLAIRVADGSFRSHAVILTSALRQLGLATSEQIDAILALHNPEIRNHNKILVGAHRAVFELARA